MSIFKTMVLVFLTFFIYTNIAWAITIEKPKPPQVEEKEEKAVKSVTDAQIPPKQEPKAELREKKSGEKPKNAPNASSPVKIQANSVKYYGNEKRSELIGNVVAVSDNYTLTADKVNVYLNDNQSIEKIVCLGNVNFKADDIIGISDSAEVDQITQIAILQGGVKVWQGENFLEGEKVTAYYVDKRIVVDKGQSSRVTIIFKSTGEQK